MPGAEQINALVARIQKGEKPPAEELAAALKASIADRIAGVDTPKKAAKAKKLEPGMLDDLLK